MLHRPDPSEYDAYYASYIGKVPDGDILRTLASQIEDTVALLAGVGPDMETYRYAPGKWSIRQVVGHMIDTEWLFAFRALWFARQAEGGQPYMDENAWADVSNAGDRPLPELIADLHAVRLASLTLYSSFDEEIGSRTGVASGVSLSVRSLAWMAAGHELHHRTGLLTNYGLGAAAG